VFVKIMMLRMDDEAALLREAGEWTRSFRQAFGSRLAKLRQRRGWKQRELARRAQIDPGRLSKLERGVVRASVTDLVRLSLTLGASLDELVFGAATSLETDWQRLRDEIEKAGGPPALDCATRMLRAFALAARLQEGRDDV
jgi:transcriptional regulator with XRE-family HTH domain